MAFYEAVKSLFLRHSDGMHRFVYRKLGDWDDAEEIVQDAFQNYLNIDSAESVENPKAFLYKTAHNLALNHLRKSGYRNAHLASLEAEEESTSLEREVISQRDVQSVQESINALPEITRRVFLANRIDGQTYPQISSEFELSISQVQKHMIKALNYLRKKLDRDPNLDNPNVSHKATR